MVFCLYKQKKWTNVNGKTKNIDYAQVLSKSNYDKKMFQDKLFIHSMSMCDSEAFQDPAGLQIKIFRKMSENKWIGI